MPLQVNGSSDEDDVSSERMKAMLDTIDKVRTTLGGLKNNQIFYEELLSSLPQFVACGPQSAGKSSVIRRVSSVSLPEASTLCTRIATIIQMRRSSSDDEASTCVTLIGPDGNNILDNKIDAEDPNSVRAAVKKAQAKALELSPSKQFIEDHSIHVHVTGPTLINVTLVDLPGFHTADDQDTKTVNDMVKRYIEMPGTLVLHVIKGDQDYASLLGNDFMRHAPKHDAGRVTVLTHCDKLDAKSAADVTRLQTTLDATADNSTLTVALLGCAEDDDEEQHKLKHLITIDDRLVVGRNELAFHLEERMRDHLNTQFPKAIAKLESSLIDTNEKLGGVRERSPVEVLCEMVKTIRDNFNKHKIGLINDFRSVVLEEMPINIKNFTLCPVKSTDCLKRKKRDNFDEELEPGQKVYTTFRTKVVDLYVVKQTGDKVSLKRKNGEEIIMRPTITELRSGETSSIKCMVDDIGELARERGMRNLVHADRQSIIAVYAKEFAEYYTDILEDVLEYINTKLNKFYDKVFSVGINDIAKPGAKYLRRQFERERHEAIKMSETAIEAMRAHNTDPLLIFTSNDHYLNSLVQKMIRDDIDMASDSGGSRHIYHDVRAYIKVQRKYISEMASKEIIRTTIIETGSRLEKLLSTGIGKLELIDLIKEPSNMARERQTLLKRRKVLEEALALAQEYYTN
jgi:hypothetical protein